MQKSKAKMIHKESKITPESIRILSFPRKWESRLWIPAYAGMTCMILCIIIFSSFFTVLPAYAWKLPMEVASFSDNEGKVYSRLVIGIESGATDSFDNLWDVPAISSHSDPDNPVHMRAYIIGTKTGRDDTRRLWKDIRGSIAGGDTVWEIVVEAAPAGKPVIISWDQPQIVLKTGEKLILKDNGKSGTVGEKMLTDVTLASNYSYVSDDEGPRSLSLMLSKESSGAPSSGGGSGFGCGTISADRHRPDDSMSAVLGTIIFFLPVVVMRLFQLRKKREELRY
jgi:hypothetical protein